MQNKYFAEKNGNVFAASADAYSAIIAYRKERWFEMTSLSPLRARIAGLASNARAIGDRASRLSRPGMPARASFSFQCGRRRVGRAWAAATNIILHKEHNCMVCDLDRNREKWMPVFAKKHATTGEPRVRLIQSETIALWGWDSIVAASETRQVYVRALKTADAGNMALLLAFART